MVKVKWTDVMTNEEDLRRADNKRSFRSTVFPKEANLLGEILRSITLTGMINNMSAFY